MREKMSNEKTATKINVKASKGFAKLLTPKALSQITPITS